MSEDHGSNITPLFGDAEQPPPAKPRVKKLRLLAIAVPLALLALVSTIFGMMMAVASDLPALENRKEYKDARNSVLYDVHGKQLGVLTNNQSRLLVQYGEISSYMRNAIIAIEDRRFYENSGVDLRGIGRAFFQDIATRRAAQGGSTIAQQFVKNALRAQGRRTVFEKLREAALAYHLTRKWSKAKILTQYLNSIYFGNGAYGIESAARTYFGNEPDHEGCGSPSRPCAKELKPQEAALLAGIVANPSAFDPVAHPAVATRRRNVVLTTMFKQNRISRLELFNSEREALPGDVQPPTIQTKAPYYTTWVRQQLVDRYGPRRAFEGGLKVYTSLDDDLQNAAQRAVDQNLANPAGPSVALVAIDNATGEVRAMVGGRNYRKAPFNLATQGQRQPGSSIKPFILASALRAGIGPGSVWPSRKRVFNVPNSSEKFVVNNFESTYTGAQTLAGGLTFSDNSVYSAVGIKVGTRKIARLARRMGIRTPISTNYAMTLGGLRQGVTPLDMAHAYESFITHGRRIEGTLGSEGGPVGIDRVKSAGGQEIDRNKVVGKRVLARGVADQAVGIMSSVVSQGTGVRAALGDGEFAAGKTGTTENSGDAWFVGFTERMTVAVWVGYPDKLRPMLTEFGGKPVEGGTYPAIIWRAFMTAANKILADRTTRERVKKGLPPVDTTVTTTPVPAAPAVPASPSTVPEGGATPTAPKTTSPAPGTPSATGAGGGTAPPSPPATPQPQPTPAPSSPQGGGGTGGTTANGGASAPPSP